MAEYVVQLTEVVKSFGELRAVDRVSLNVRPGGKTTTLRIIGGFESPDAGEILIQGKNVTGVPPRRTQYQYGFSRLCPLPSHDSG
jgi:ABC-type Fe3+/spermidine/putrescine transport system ATPase subunit